MKKRTTIRISAFLLCLCCAFFTSCKEDDGKGYVFGYDISSNPGSLDPQYASDRESYLIIGSVFEGLFRIGADGNAEKAMAESYTVSDDGLTYNFKLKQDRYWTDVNGYNKKVTAADFVFGFRRLFLPETRAPKASEYVTARSYGAGGLFAYNRTAIYRAVICNASCYAGGYAVQRGILHQGTGQIRS